MTTLSAKSREAVERLRNYVPPENQWDDLDVTRRAAVLILLFPDAKGELRVVLTERSNALRTFAGQVALPGGKADNASESAFATARRESSEEIGLPVSNDRVPFPFIVSHLCEMPMNLSRNNLGVRPCVALLHSLAFESVSQRNKGTEQDDYAFALPQNKTNGVSVTAEESLIPKLDPKEVASVFTVPFEAFLEKEFEMPELAANGSATIDTEDARKDKAGWYEGAWLEWYNVKWRAHTFNVHARPAVVQRQTSSDNPSNTGSRSTSREKEEMTSKGRGVDDKKLVKYKVWGMTARIVVDAARVAYGRNPNFEFVEKAGDDDVMAIVMKEGKLGPKIRGEAEPSARDQSMRADGRNTGKL